MEPLNTISATPAGWELVRAFVAACIGALLAFLEPVTGAMTLLLIVALADILTGIVTDLRVNGTCFRFRKFFFALVCAAVYLLIVALVYTVGLFQDDVQECLFIVKTITYTIIYFYAVNIFRNLRQLLPSNRAIAFLYYLLGLEFTKKFPALDDFLKKEKEEKNG